MIKKVICNIEGRAFGKDGSAWAEAIHEEASKIKEARKGKVTWHTLKDRVLAMKDGKQILEFKKNSLPYSDQIIRDLEQHEWFDEEQKKEFLYRVDVCLNPEKHALKIRGGRI